MKSKNLCKKAIILPLISIFLAGCNSGSKGEKEDIGGIEVPSSYNVGWTTSSRQEAIKRLEAIENTTSRPEYKFFDKEVTVTSVYDEKSEVTDMDNPKDVSESHIIHTSTYTYNPGNLAFRFTYDKYFVEEDIHSVRTLNVTKGELNGKSIIESQHRMNQYEEFEVSTYEIPSGTNPRAALEEEIESWLFYIGFNLYYYVENIIEASSEATYEEDVIVRSSDFNVKFSTKSSDGVRIEASEEYDIYGNQNNTNVLRYEIQSSSTFDAMVLNNMVIKYVSASEATIKDYSYRTIEHEVLSTNLITVENSNLEKIALLSK